MILVITGTEVHSFDRLVKQVDLLASEGVIADTFFVQLGHTHYEPKHCQWKRFIGFGEMCDAIEKSSMVISHAGAGATLLSIQCGKRPIIVPRRKQYGEHVDEHQVLFAQRLHQFNLARTVEDVMDLEQVIREEGALSASSRKLPEASSLVDFLDNLLEEWQLGRVKSG